MELSKRILVELRKRLGEQAVRTGSACEAETHTDWSGAPASVPRAVVLPDDPQGVALTLGLCNQAGQHVCVQGGLTGLAGGANPRDGEIVLSLKRLSAIEDIDSIGGTAIVQAGVTLQTLQERVAEVGWSVPVDLGARGSCHIGGNAATNAGGLQVLRFGMTRETVLGLEVALPDGTLLSMLDRVVKNNTGLDLKQLFIGTEGTLGVITRLALRLTPLMTASRTVLCAVPTFKAATLLLREARRTITGLVAFELMWHPFLSAAARVTGRVLPFNGTYPLYALFEVRAASEDLFGPEIERLLEGCLDDSVISDAVIAQSGQQSREIWALRESTTELMAALAPVVNFDVSIPSPQMETFIDEIQTSLASHYPGQEHLLFGHLGDNNLHLMSGPFPDAADIETVERLVYAAVGALGGSISAEHGIGVKKKNFLHHSRAHEEIALMRRIKSALDPNGILNCGRVFD